jgi:ferredoxin-NADP reductase
MARAAVQRRLTWQLGTVVGLVEETSRVRTILLDVPDWQGHGAGQHVDVRLTADDGYQAQRSYSIASAPGENRLALTVERLEDGEVSPYLVDELRAGDLLEFRGPIGGYFVWEAGIGAPLFLVAGGSGIAPLMAMTRHRSAVKSAVPARLLYSSRSLEDVIYRDEIDGLAHSNDGFEVFHTLTRTQPQDWRGFKRRVDVQMLSEVAWPPHQKPAIFVCGPTAFVEVIANGLVALGYDSKLIKTERFGPTGG